MNQTNILNTTFNAKANAVLNNGLFSRRTMPCMHPSMDRLYRAALDLCAIEGQSNVARALNRTPQNMTAWENRGVSKEGMLDAEKRFGCSALWLRTGEGDMRSGAPVARATVEPIRRDHPDRDINEVIRLMEATDATGRKIAAAGIRVALAGYTPHAAGKKGRS